jgi:hypothetical protein
LKTLLEKELNELLTVQHRLDATGVTAREQANEPSAVNELRAIVRETDEAIAAMNARTLETTAELRPAPGTQERLLSLNELLTSNQSLLDNERLAFRGRRGRAASIKELLHSTEPLKEKDATSQFGPIPSAKEYACEEVIRKLLGSPAPSESSGASRRGPKSPRWQDTA